jgi:hypothetical protein
LLDAGMGDHHQPQYLQQQQQQKVLQIQQQQKQAEVNLKISTKLPTIISTAAVVLSDNESSDEDETSAEADEFIVLHEEATPKSSSDYEAENEYNICLMYSMHYIHFKLSSKNYCRTLKEKLIELEAFLQSSTGKTVQRLEDQLVVFTVECVLYLIFSQAHILY